MKVIQGRGVGVLGGRGVLVGGTGVHVRVGVRVRVLLGSGVLVRVGVSVGVEV